MIICKAEICTGCMACKNSCPHKAILEVQNQKGFYVPHIETPLCTEYGLCQSVCPANHPPQEKREPQVYACWSKDENIRKSSSSGGLFTLLAQQTIAKGGVVFGAVFNAPTQTVQHTMASTVQELKPMRGSKYVQSKLGGTFLLVKEKLQQNIPVLFTGTPCQIAGLKRFLGQVPEQLLCVDLLCHGVPSPAVFTRYLQETLQGEPAISVSFREKSISWEVYSMHMQGENGTRYVEHMYKDPYLRLFIQGLSLNGCCHQCAYASSTRHGDITLGDFWGYLTEHYSLRNQNKGISLVLVNSEKGNNTLRQLLPQVHITKKTLQEAISGNPILIQPCAAPQERHRFWQAIADGERLTSFSRKLQAPIKPSYKHFVRLQMDNHFFLLPKPLKAKYRRMRYHHALSPKNKTE